MQRSQRTTSRFTRLCQFGAVLLSVPILMAIGCPLTVTVNCPADGTAGTAATVTVTVSFGQGAATWTTDVTNGTVADGTMASPSVTPSGAGTVTVTVTATDEAGDSATNSCEFEATAAECTDDADCADNGVFCDGAETCVDGACTSAGDPCAGTATPVCDETGDACVECTADTDCAADEVCANNACVATCTDDADCDDGDACTTDTCTDSACSNTTDDVDDGVFCNGTESCDSATGDVTSSGDPCAGTAAPVCDEDNDTCVECLTDADCTGADTCDANVCVTPACTEDADCDDGLFCNGAETCDTTTDPDNPVCVDGTDPCAGTDCGANTPLCEEGDASAVCSCPTVPTFDFTLNTDNLTGTTGDDTFFAPTAFDSGTFNTFQTGDSANGLAGDDLVNVFFAEASGTTVPGTLAGIETINITDNSTGGPETVNMTNSSDVATIANINSTQTVTITSMPNIPNLAVTGSDTGISVAFETNATNTTTDAIGITLNDVQGGIVTLITNNGSNGFDTVTITSSGSADNTLAALTETTGDSITAINFGGSAKLTVAGSLDATAGMLATVDGSSNAGGLSLLFGATLNLTVTGGSGDDMFNFGTTFTTTTSAKDTVDGGDGTDTVVILMNSSQTTAADFTSVETLRLEGDDDGNAETFTLGLSNVDITTVELESQGAAVTADTITLSQIPYPSTGTPTLRLRGDGTDANQTFDGLTFTFTGAGGSADHGMTIAFDNRESETPSGTAFTRVDGVTERTITVASIGVDNIEDVTITNSNANLTVTAFDATQLESLVITSSGDVTLGTIDSTVVDTVNLSGCTEDTSINVGSSTEAIVYTAGTKENTITTGSGGDTVTGGANDDTIDSGDGVDIIDAGGGDDIVTTDAAGTSADADTVNLGTGDDVLRVFGVNNSSANADVVTGFTKGANNDQLEFDFSQLTTAAAIFAGVTVNFVQFGGTDVTNATAVDVVECTVGGGACDVAAAAANVIVMVGGNITSIANLQTALEAGGGSPLTVAIADTDVSDGFMIVYDDGTDAFLAACYADTETAADTDYETGDLTCLNLVELDGFGDIVAADFDTSNFDWIP